MSLCNSNEMSLIAVHYMVQWENLHKLCSYQLMSPPKKFKKQGQFILSKGINARCKEKEQINYCLFKPNSFLFQPLHCNPEARSYLQQRTNIVLGLEKIHYFSLSFSTFEGIQLLSIMSYLFYVSWETSKKKNSIAYSAKVFSLRCHVGSFTNDTNFVVVNFINLCLSYSLALTDYGSSIPNTGYWDKH